MKITILSHTIQKGAGHPRVNYEIAKAALLKGHEVTMLAASVSEDLKRFSKARFIEIPWTPIPTQLVKCLDFAKKSQRWLDRGGESGSLRQTSGFVTYAECIVNTSHMVHGAWLKSPYHPIHLWRSPMRYYQWLYTAVNARLERRSYRDAGVVVAVSKKVKGQLAEIGIEEKKIRVIMNGVDTEEYFPSTDEGRGARKRNGFAISVPTAIFVGDIRTPLKNLETVLNALKQVPRLHLIVAGDTMRSPYPRMAARLKLTDRVHFTGYRRDIAELMRCADFFVFPSRTEACPLVMFEALASGLPVLTAATVGACEVVSGSCGFVQANPNDAEELAKNMQTLLDDPDLRRSMQTAARGVAEQFTWKRMTDSYLELYEELPPA